MMPLDKNESYWLLDDELVEAATMHSREALATYPDYTELKQRIAAYAGVAPEQVCLGPGSDALIEALANTLVGDGEAILPVPTFYGYEAILARAGSQVVPTYYKEDGSAFIFPLDDTVAVLLKGSAKALFLCQPNNPLGCAIPEDAIAALAAAARKSDAYIVSDEAYFEFSGRTMLEALAQMPHLILVRTLSKGFGLSGARIGYGIASPEIVARLSKRLLPWPIAHTSVSAALALLARSSAVEKRRVQVIAAREAFLASLATIPGVTAYSSETNFVLVRVEDATAARDALLAKGIRVALGAPMSRFPQAQALLDSTLRIAIPSPEDLPVFLTAFEPLFTK